MILLSTGSLHLYGTRRAFSLAAEAGFEGIEVTIDSRADTWQIDYLKKISTEFNLQIAALHSPFLLNIPYWPHHEGERIERTVEIAEELGVDTVIAHLPSRWPISLLISNRHSLPFPHFWKRNQKAVAWFEQQLPFIQAETELAIAIEIMPLYRKLRWPINAYVWNTLAEWVRFEHLTLDTTHCGTWKVDPRTVYDRATGKVSHIHLSNYDGQEHRLPHQGKLRLDKFLKHIAKNGYQGHISIETDPTAMESNDLSRVKENLKASLAFCQEHFQS